MTEKIKNLVKVEDMLMYDELKSFTESTENRDGLIITNALRHWTNICKFPLSLLKEKLKRLHIGTEIATSQKTILLIASRPVAFPILSRRRTSITSEGVMLIVFNCGELAFANELGNCLLSTLSLVCV
jgi:hypothetical protein